MRLRERSNSRPEAAPSADALSSANRYQLRAAEAVVEGFRKGGGKISFREKGT